MYSFWALVSLSLAAMSGRDRERSFGLEDDLVEPLFLGGVENLGDALVGFLADPHRPLGVVPASAPAPLAGHPPPPLPGGPGQVVDLGLLLLGERQLLLHRGSEQDHDQMGSLSDPPAQSGHAGLGRRGHVAASGTTSGSGSGSKTRTVTPGR